MIIFQVSYKNTCSTICMVPGCVSPIIVTKGMAETVKLIVPFETAGLVHPTSTISGAISLAVTSLGVGA